MRVLHLASFSGNMGDELNHAHTRQQLTKTFDFQYTNLEIREYYKSWGMRKWEDLPAMANDYDLLMIGGGNFLETCHDTKTSTTIDLSIEQLKSIRVPILFYGVGVDPAKGIKHPERFKSFLDYIQETPNRLIVVRNDGSKQDAKDLFGVDLLEVPDGGFYFKCARPPGKHWAINVACDMPDIRRNWVLKCLPDFLNHKLSQDPNLYIVFVPHIFSDLKAISDVMDRIEDKYRLHRISVAAHNMGDIFLMYKCELTLAMRFHANIASLAVNTPTIALNTYPKIEKLYNGLGLEQVANSRSDLERLVQGFDQRFELPSILEAHGKIWKWLENTAS